MRLREKVLGGRIATGVTMAGCSAGDDDPSVSFADSSPKGEPFGGTDSSTPLRVAQNDMGVMIPGKNNRVAIQTSRARIVSGHCPPPVGNFSQICACVETIFAI